MKRFSTVMIFIGVLLWTHAAVSKTWTDTKSNNTFSFTGTTVATSTQHGGHGTTYYRVSGSADISGTAYALGDNTVYKAELYLMVSGDINTSAFPGKSNIDTKRIEDGVFHDTHTSGVAKILYTSHPVGSLAKNEADFTQAQAKKSLSDSTSASYVKGSYSSPTGLSASPECYGSLSGTIMNHVGSKGLDSLTFQSESNTVTGDDSDDGTQNQVAEKCDRKQNCQKPGTATSAYSHRVQCPEEIWVLAGEAWKLKRYKRTPCPSYWWTCDDDPKNPNTLNKCLREHRHIKPGEKSWQWKYVDPNGNVSQYPPNLPCGHSYGASGDHSEVKYACGDHSYYACQTPSRSEKNRHTYLPLPCGKHSGYLCRASSSHTQTVSCPTNANGQKCLYGSYYPCSPHTHAYPAPPTTPVNPPSPPQPTTVACGARGWTGCTAAVSSRYEHKVTSCSGCGRTYWTCSSYASNHTDTKTCRYSECRQTWKRCSKAPVCNKPWRKRNGLKCWAS